MNWLDLVLLLVIAWFAIAGASAGLLRELVTLLAMVAGVVLAGLFHDELAEDILVMVESARVARIGAFAAIFFAMLAAGQIAANLLKDVALALALGPLDRSGGLVVGLAKAAIIVEAGLFLFARYHLDMMVDAMDGSLLTPFFLRGAPFLLALLPGDFRSAVELFPAELQSVSKRCCPGML